MRWNTEVGNMRCEVAELELDLASYDGSFTTLDAIRPIRTNLTHTDGSDPTPGFSTRRREGGYGDAWITPAEIASLARD